MCGGEDAGADVGPGAAEAPPGPEAPVPAAAVAEAAPDPPANKLCAGGTGCSPRPGVRIGVRLPAEAELDAEAVAASGGGASGKRRFGTVGPSGKTGFRASGGTGGGGCGVGAAARRGGRADELAGGGVRIGARGRSA